jgi:cycloeucalenol cycloisomerase
MFFATHFYFSSYHVFANLFLRRVLSGFQPGAARAALFAYTVVALSYATAFMETLTIAHFPYCE